MKQIQVKYQDGTLLINLDLVKSAFYRSAQGHQQDESKSDCALDFRFAGSEQPVTLTGEEADRVWALLSQNQSPQDKIITITDGHWVATRGINVVSPEYALNGIAFSMIGGGGEYGNVEANKIEIYQPGQRISLDSSFFDPEHFGSGKITVQETHYDYRYTQAIAFYLTGKLNFTGEAKVPQPTDHTATLIKLTAPFKFEGNLEGHAPDHPQTPTFSVQLKGSGLATVELNKYTDGSQQYSFKSIRYEFQQA